MNTKVVIADDHPVFREGFKMVMYYLKNVECIGEAQNGKELLCLINKISIDVVFIDIKMPFVDGFEATKEIMKIKPDIKIIAITSYDNIELANRMIELGVNGYMLKDAEYSEIGEAINIVMNNKSYISSQILVKLSHFAVHQCSETKKKKLPEITEREKELLQLLCEGLSKNEIAKKMFVSERTIEKYKERLMAKTDTNTTVKLILYALKNNITKI